MKDASSLVSWAAGQRWFRSKARAHRGGAILEEVELEGVKLLALRVDFEDGFGMRPDAEEDEAVDRAVAALVAGPMPPFVGLRCKSLEHRTRRRAIRTADRFLDVLLRTADLPANFLITLPKVSVVEQVTAMVTLCERLEEAHDLPAGTLRLELQVRERGLHLGEHRHQPIARHVLIVRVVAEEAVRDALLAEVVPLAGIDQRAAVEEVLRELPAGLGRRLRRRRRRWWRRSGRGALVRLAHRRAAGLVLVLALAAGRERQAQRHGEHRPGRHRVSSIGPRPDSIRSPRTSRP